MRAALDGRPKAAVPTSIKIEIPCWAREVRDFLQIEEQILAASPELISDRANSAKAVSGAGFREILYLSLHQIRSCACGRAALD
jgi:hypothetical protein